MAPVLPRSSEGPQKLLIHGLSASAHSAHHGPRSH